MTKTVLFFSLVFCLSGCATIIHGSHQSIGIGSSPTGAKVYVDDQLMGQTPTIVNLPRKYYHQIKIDLPGYQPYEMQFTRKVDAWIAGNILFGGLIGLGVDAITGSMYKLTPDQVQATLSHQEAFFPRKQNDIFITVVLKPDPGWLCIGQLTRLK